LQITHKEDDTAPVVHLELPPRSEELQLEHLERSVDSVARPRIQAHQEHLVNQFKLMLLVASAPELLDQQIRIPVHLEQVRRVHLVRMHLKHPGLVQEQRVHLVQGQQADSGLRLVVSVKRQGQERLVPQNLHSD